MQRAIDVTAVTAVSLGDGWRSVMYFAVVDNLYGTTVPIAGAVWQENGCECSAPLTAILATNRGTPPAVDVLTEVRPSVHPNLKVQEALTWLEEILQRGPHDVNYLIKRAKEEHNIRSTALYRAKTALGIKPYTLAGRWMWELPAPEAEPQETKTA